MEQWKLPELHQSAAGYRLEVPGQNTIQEDPEPVSHEPGPTKTSITSDFNRTERVPFFNNWMAQRLLKRVKKNHEVVRCNLQARLDVQEGRNRYLTKRFESLQQYESYLTSLNKLKRKVEEAESYGGALRKKIQKIEEVVEEYKLEDTPEGVSDDEKTDTSTDEDENEEVDAEENLEVESAVEENQESDCFVDEDEY